MAKRQSFNFGGKVYPTKKSVVEQCRTLLYGSAIGETVADHVFLNDLLALHPDAVEKRGQGVKRFFIRAVDEYGPNARCFGIERTDGTTTDFSFNMCLATDKQRSKEADLIAAMRNAIHASKEEFKTRWFLKNQNEDFEVQCPVRKTWIKQHDAHADHVAPKTFQALYTTFIAENGLDPEQVAVLCKGDNLVNNELMDDALRAKWLAWHDANAVLEVVSREANLSDRRKTQPTP